MKNTPGAALALTVSTIAFTACFAVWVINGVLVTHLVSSNTLPFTDAQVGWLLAAPVLTGSLSRVPLGIATDRFGGRIVFTLLLLASAIPLAALSYADSFAEFLLASFGFGLAGGGFAVGVGYVSVWFSKERQGTALGVFGMGNAGAALTTLVAPALLARLVADGPEGWRTLPRLYAAVLVGMAVVFYLTTTSRRPSAPPRTLAEQLAPLKSMVVWRLGLYYLLVFGGFVAMAQYIVPYSVSVYEVSVVQAGLLASVFSLPSGAIRAIGGVMSDRFGARVVMYWVFGICVVSCAVLSVPKLDILSPGPAVAARVPGIVESVSSEAVVVGGHTYLLLEAPDPTTLPKAVDDGARWLPTITTWQEPVVEVGDELAKKDLVARGVTNVYYPSPLGLFAIGVLVFGLVTGIGKASVYKFIPDLFPDQVGAVGGMVGLIGGLGGFVLPLLFGYLNQWTGLISTAWMVLTLLSVICAVWMAYTVRQVMVGEAPELANLIERRPARPASNLNAAEAQTLADAIRAVPLLSYMKPHEVDALASVAETTAAAADERIFGQGDPGESLFVVLKGAVRIHQRGADGADVTISTMKRGQVFGVLSLLDGKPRSASATALEPSMLLVLTRSDFLRLLGSSPRLVADLLVLLASAVRKRDVAQVVPAPPPSDATP